MKKLLVFGAGQYSHVAAEIAQSVGLYEKIDFLDDNVSHAIGKISEYDAYLDSYDEAIVAIGNSKVRLQLLGELQEKIPLATLISPRAYVSPSAYVAGGCVVEPMAVIHANARVETGCLISAGAVVNHDACLAAGCHVDCNAVVTSSERILSGTRVKIGNLHEIL